MAIIITPPVYRGFDAVGIFNRQQAVVTDLQAKLDEELRLQALEANALNADFGELQTIKNVARAIKNTAPVNSSTFIQAQSIENKAEREEIGLNPNVADILEQYQAANDFIAIPPNRALSRTI